MNTGCSVGKASLIFLGRQGCSAFATSQNLSALAGLVFAVETHVLIDPIYQRPIVPKELWLTNNGFRRRISLLTAQPNQPQLSVRRQ